MKKLLLLILLFPLFTYAQKTYVFDTNDAKKGEPINGTQINDEEPKESQSAERFTVFLESNINYAPIGVKLMIQEKNKVGAYLTVKISEDYFFRNVTEVSNVANAEKYSSAFDINELIICGGAVFNIANNIDVYTGVGILTGSKYVLDYYYTDVNPTTKVDLVRREGTEWVKTDKSSLIPMLSFGIILTKDRFKFSFGNETAFAKDTDYPIGYLNTKSFARLSSVTFGIGYSFSR